MGQLERIRRSKGIICGDEWKGKGADVFRMAVMTREGDSGEKLCVKPVQCQLEALSYLSFTH